MALTPTFLLPFLLLTSAASASPSAISATLSKDPSTLQYTLSLPQLHLPPLSLHLGGRYLLLPCSPSSSSLVSCRSHVCASSASTIGCNSCLSPSSPFPSCHNRSCSVAPDNPFSRFASPSELAHSSSHPRLVFACAFPSLLSGLAPSSLGIAGLSRSPLALPSQLSPLPSRFSLCLPRTLLLGSSPPTSTPLLYTPLLSNPVSTAVAFVSHEPSYEYFIGLRSIKIAGVSVPLNSTLLSINAFGIGGTKISTADPYSVMESGIYSSFADAFERESGMRRTASPRPPFSRCFESKSGKVPEIDLVLQNDRVVWRMGAANSVVEVENGVICLAFVDGGEEPRTSIVIGGHQIEENLLEFDLAGSRLGFSSSLMYHGTTC